MSSPVFRQAFACFPEGETVERALQQTVVKIIHLNYKQDQHHEKEEWHQHLSAEGVNISYLQHPCKLNRVNDKAKTLAEIEAKHCFSDSFWPKVLEEPVAGAIAISHLRALNEALENPKAGLIIILEGDATGNENTVQLFASLVANWFCNQELKWTNCIALTFSSWHGLYDGMVRQHHRVVKNSKVQPYFQLIEMPWVQQQNGQYRYNFVGQGARALAYSREFAQHLLEQKVSHYYDMWVIGQLTKQRLDWKRHRGQEYNTLYLLCEPPIFEHVPTFGKRFRGSGRLESMAPNSATEESYYITVELTWEWGLCNRINTILTLGHICAMARFGMYILWTATKACPGQFEEVLALDTENSILKKIPFIQIFDDPKDSNWKAAKHNQHWNKAHFESQCSIAMGVKYFLQSLSTIAKQRNDKYMLHTMIPKMATELQKENMEMFLQVDKDIVALAEGYIQKARALGTIQVAVHLRRGDHKWFNCNKKAEMMDERKAVQIYKQWREADDEVMDRPRKISENH